MGEYALKLTPAQAAMLWAAFVFYEENLIDMIDDGTEPTSAGGIYERTRSRLVQSGIPQTANDHTFGERS